MKITITKEQLLAAGALPDCVAYQKFVADFPNGVTLEWTPEKQLELLRHPVWRTALGWLWENKILPALSMKNVDLNGADLSMANLIRADLNGADLSGAYLSGAYLSGATLYRADLTNVISDENTVWPAGFDIGKEIRA